MKTHFPATRSVSRPIVPVLLILLVALPDSRLAAQASVPLPAANPVAPTLRQRFDGEFRQRLPAASAGQVEKAEQAFLEHLRATSSIAAEQLTSGHIDPDDLTSRIDVFLADHPEFIGPPANASAAGPRAQVVEAFRRYSDLARTDAEREHLADRFIVWLGNLSGSACDTLLAGRMPADELQSRIDVYAGDVRTERNQVVMDPALAAVPAIAEAFEKANLGPVTERADAICCRGSVTENGISRDFVLFKKRPASIRLHALKGDIVIGVLAYDGTTAWRQTPSRPAEELHGAEASSLIASARFDDPLVGYRERGAVARLESAPGATPLRLSIREPDGSEVTETIDPANYQELTQSRRDAQGRIEETRFRDYKRIGPLNYPGTQEVWIDGVLHSTTQMRDVRLDAGVLARFFAKPSGLKLDYMDYMGGLAAIEKLASKHADGGIVLPKEASK